MSYDAGAGPEITVDSGDENNTVDILIEVADGTTQDPVAEVRVEIDVADRHSARGHSD